MAHPPRLLIVEDEVLLATWLRELVEHAGYRVCAVAAEGPDAVREALTQRPDLVLLDMQLRAGTDGVATALEIERRAGLPVLFLTGHPERFAATAAGLACLAKPYGRDDLVAAVAYVLAKAQGRATAPPPAGLLVRERSRAPGETPALVPAEGDARFKGVFEHATHGIAVVGLDHRIVDVNAAFASLFDTAPDRLGGVTIEALGSVFGPLGEALGRCAEGAIDTVAPIEITRRDGAAGSRHLRLSAALVRGRGGEPRYVVVNAEDMSDRRATEAALRQQALRDPLTGVWNREFLATALEERLGAPARAGQEGAVLLVDLDDFKQVNDTLGHACGDIVLRAVAARLGERLRRDDVLARLGGDEFAALLDGVDIDAARAVALDLAERIQRPIACDDGWAKVGVSIGVAALRTGHTASAVLQNADHALYRAKADPRRRVLVFEEAEAAGPAPLDSLARQLRAALAAGALCVRLEPEVDLVTGAWSAAALQVHWSPARPAAAMDLREIWPLARESGLLATLARWLVETAARAGRDARAVPIVLDLAGLASPEDALGLLADAVGESRGLRLEAAVPARYVDRASAQATLAACRDAGIGLSIADVGLEPLSWWALRELPIAKARLAPAVVAELGVDTRADAVVRATVDLARSFELLCVADGVTTERQKERLATLGCRYARGDAIVAAMAPGAVRCRERTAEAG